MQKEECRIMKTNTKGLRTTAESPNGKPFSLSHDYCYSHVTAKLSHATKTSVTFKDARGNYANVQRVRNGLAWLKTHGYGDSDAARFSKFD